MGACASAPTEPPAAPPTLETVIQTHTTQVLRASTAEMLEREPSVSVGHAGQYTSSETQSRGHTRHASVCMRGVVPYGRNRLSYDCYLVKYALNGDPDTALWAVVDGHGEYGERVAEFCKRYLVMHMSSQLDLKTDTEESIAKAIKSMCDHLVTNKDINSAFSGASLCCVLKVKDVLYIANIGNARCVLCRKDPDEIDDGSGIHDIQVASLTIDHDPERKSERERILKLGGRIHPLKDIGGPDRVWLAELDTPGLVVTRSIGDTVCQTVGVIPAPEIRRYEVTSDDLFLVLATDGLWKFMSNEDACNIVNEGIGMECATGRCCQLLAMEARRRWREKEDVMDDITVVLIRFQAD